MKPGWTMKSLMGAALALVASCALARLPPPPPPVQVENGWIRWLPANLPAAGYATLRNNGDQPMKLVGADSPDYGMVMLHRSMQSNGKDIMRMVETLTIPAHGEVELAPGGYHLMLSSPKHSIKPGDAVRVSLHFYKYATIQATLPVRPANASGG